MTLTILAIAAAFILGAGFMAMVAFGASEDAYRRGRLDALSEPLRRHVDHEYTPFKPVDPSKPPVGHEPPKQADHE